MTNEIPSVGSETGPWGAVPVWILEYPLSAAELKVYISLRSFSNITPGASGDQGIFPRVQVIADRAHVTKRTAEKAITKLRDLNLIDTTRRHDTRGWIKGCDYFLFDMPRRPVTEAGNARSLTPVTPNRRNGRLRSVEMDGDPTVEMDGAVTDHPYQTTDQSMGNSIEGTPVRVRASADRRKKPITVDALMNKPATHVTKTLTSLWSALVLQSGGYLPTQEKDAWDKDGLALAKDPHPVGSQVKNILAEHPHLLKDRDALDQLLASVRKHADEWASAHRLAA